MHRIASETTPLLYKTVEENEELSSNIIPAIPIVQQPLPSNYQNPADKRQNPLGLQYLNEVDQLWIGKKYDSMMTNSIDKFFVKNSEGGVAYLATEHSTLCGRQYLSGTRALYITVRDMYNNQIFNTSRGRECGCCCFPCCVQYFEVQTPIKNVIGVIQQEWMMFSLLLIVKNESGNVLCCVSRNRMNDKESNGDQIYKILADDREQEIGKITRLKNKVIGYHSCYTINFPEAANVELKMLLVSALFTIHYMDYE